MSVNKLISIKNAIIDAQDFLGIDHDKDVPFFTRLATLAEKEIGSARQYERTKTVVTICGCTAPIPNDCALVEVVVMGDYNNNCNNLLTQFCGNQSFTNVTLSGQAAFLVIDVGSPVGETTSFGYKNLIIQNNKLVFDTDLDGQVVTIQYLKFKTDCDGFLEIGENHVNAIRWYIIYHYLFRMSSGNYIERDKMNMAFQEWNRECRHARAEDNRLTESEQREVSLIYTNPHSGRGLWEGMYTTLGNSYFIWG
jgi:hypothetical protein